MKVLFGDWWNEMDVADRTMFLRIALADYIICTSIEYAVLGPGSFSGPTLILLLFIVNPVIAIAFARAGFWIISRFAHSAVHGLAGSGGDPYSVGYSEQESMVIRGEWQKAIDSYRALLRSNPGNHEARLRLARLILRNGVRDDSAESHYLEVRAKDTEGVHEAEVSNALIDLYRASGRQDDLRRELTRTSQKHAGTPRGDGARRELREMATRSDSA